MISDETINEASYLVDITFGERKHRQVFKNGFRPCHIHPVEHKVRSALRNRQTYSVIMSIQLPHGYSHN